MQLHSRLFLSFMLVSWPASTVADEDPSYEPSQNFRPENVTGLNRAGPYAWVGSYYNMTTSLKLTPVMGGDIDDPLCTSLMGYTASQEFDATLMITDRGTYNEGTNTANLVVLKDTVNFESEWDQAKVPVILQSSEMTWKYAEHSSVPDLFDLTTSYSQDTSRYEFSGTPTEITEGSPFPSSFNITMPSCNASEQVGIWTFSVLAYEPGVFRSTLGWDDYKAPTLEGYFDDEKAELTVSGAFQSLPFMRPNSTTGVTGNDHGVLGGDTVQGRFQMTMTGVMDVYHSDRLLMDQEDDPSWRNTVGFHRDMRNIGYFEDDDSGSTRQIPDSTLRSVFALVLLTFGVHHMF